MWDKAKYSKLTINSRKRLIYNHRHIFISRGKRDLSETKEQQGDAAAGGSGSGDEDDYDDYAPFNPCAAADDFRLNLTFQKQVQGVQ